MDYFKEDPLEWDLEFDDFLRDIDSEEALISKISETSKHLNNVDYSLNSPLIQDEVQEFCHFAKGRPFARRWNIDLWIRRKSCFGCGSELLYPETFHKWWAGYNLKSKVNTTLIDRILEETAKDAELTFLIPGAFIKGWLGKEITNPKGKSIPQDIRKWGALFIEMHYIVLILNASTLLEGKKAATVFKYRETPSILERGYKLITQNWGDVDICGGFIYLRQHKTILDRSMALMMKDTYSARFQSLLGMIERVDNKYAADDWMRLNDLYKIGDRILSRTGSKGYSCIKMTEPICNWKLCEMVRRYRPLIPKFPNFGKHVEEAIAELSVLSHDMQAFFHHIWAGQSFAIVLAFYGSFRHWGHPFVDALVGIQKLHERVTATVEVDKEYANCLASDLALKVLEQKFRETSKWFVDLKNLDPGNKMYSHVESGTWPTPKEVIDFGDQWHLLPLTQCFDIPDVVNPSTIYSDKSHSMNKSEVIGYVQTGNPRAIPTRRVLDTMINKEATNWKAFLDKIESEGVDDDSLVIGLRVKERELKEEGRFFALMSWELREYFVITEYLIKTHFLPMFDGLTMADDLTTLTKKLLDRSSGHGHDDYSTIGIANHLDYQKWNQFQRGEANDPVFIVMGKFCGRSKLFLRTHEIFRACLVYLISRPDLMKVVDEKLVNKFEETTVCWYGQAGGFEGLRQKGWTVVDALSIERMCKFTNARVMILAQGDNQIIILLFRLQVYRCFQELMGLLEQIVKINTQVMNAIEEGINRLGQRINRDETMQSADYLNYGKIPIIRGVIHALEEKRWSRNACVTNDQLPTLGNVLSTVSSNALTISHNSTSPLNTIIHYNYIGNFVRIILDSHNPAIRGPVSDVIRGISKESTIAYKIFSLYLDPCLGGVSGMSLTRFLIRNFPDPVCESLSFWKVVHDNINWKYQPLCVQAGHCKIARLTASSFSKLLENPLSLNLVSSVSATSVIKDVIRSALYEKQHIPNEVVRDAINFSKANNDILCTYLMSVDPLFPRFLSEFKSATCLGITESIIGLFENSKTIRNVFKRKIGNKIDKIIISSEVQSIRSLHRDHWTQKHSKIWSCSASYSDNLRELSWGRPVLGATIPHPIELLITYDQTYNRCQVCSTSSTENSHLVTILPRGLFDYEEKRGETQVYVGSHTSESTSLVNPWTKNTDVPLIRKACRLRNAVHWFVEPGSNLAESIFSILTGLTGEDWSVGTEGFQRTGSGLHRYMCDRQSSGGYAACSPAKLSHMTTTTDTLGEINEDNHDFMYQAMIIYSQITVGELHDQKRIQGVYHHHIKCTSCVRPIGNPKLDAPDIYIHPDVSTMLSAWKPNDTPWATQRVIPSLPEGDWSALTDEERSYHIGRTQGFTFCDSVLSRICSDKLGSLFPLTLAYKLSPQGYLEGLVDGIVRGSALHALSRRAVQKLRRPRSTLLGTVLYVIDLLSLESSAVNIWRHKNFILEFSRVPHRIPASYPLSNIDLGSVGRSYLKYVFKRWCVANEDFATKVDTCWVFSDVNSIRLTGSLAMSTGVAHRLYSANLKQSELNYLRELKSLMEMIRDPQGNIDISCVPGFNKLRRIDSEVRHAATGMIPKVHVPNCAHSDWGTEIVGFVVSHQIRYRSVKITKEFPKTVPRIQVPMISGLRLFQCATGSHYKIRSIVKHYNIQYRDCAALGDGSGGVGCWLLRNNPSSRLFFNSLLTLGNVSLRGSSPSGPAAIEFIPEVSDRCVNLRSSWRYPNDLSHSATWLYMIQEIARQDMVVDLVVMDMEVQDMESATAILEFTSKYICKVLHPSGTLIFKTYLSLIYDHKYPILEKLGVLFEKTHICWTEFTSSKSSEVYLVFTWLSDSNRHTYPDYEDLEGFSLDTPVFRSDISEYQRASIIFHKDMMEGVPYRYRCDPFVELTTLLMTLGVHTGVSALLGEMIKDEYSESQMSSVAMATLIVAINSLLRITHGSWTRWPPYNDPTVRNVGALVLGFLYWLSMVSNRIDFYNWSNIAIKHVFPFTWVNMKEKVTERGMWYRYVSFRNRHLHCKNFHLDNELAKIGQVLRVFTRLFRRASEPPKMHYVESFIANYDFDLEMSKFQRRCDIIQLVCNPTYPNGLEETYRSMTTVDPEVEVGVLE